jgi:subtilisin-like proprotein convertase family protein
LKRLTAYPRKRIVFAGVGVGVAAVVATGVALATTFTNAGSISITDAPPKPTTATPYPSPIAVSALVGQITDVNVSMNGLTHSAPDDIDVLVTNPGGGKVIIMSDAGDTFPVSQAITLTFDDAASGSLPDTTMLSGGTFKPTNYGTSGTDDPFCFGEPLDESGFPAPAPASPYSSALSAFNTQAPNGTWNVYVTDDCAGGTGSFAGGWTVDIATNPTGVTVTSLTSAPAKSGVTVRWRTSSEAQIAGFNVYRANTKLNKRLIGARHAGVAHGSAYSLLDRGVRKGASYTYRLQVVGLDGKRSWYGATAIYLAS